MADRPAQAPLPPPLAMMQLLFGKQLTYSLSGVARLGVADHMDGTAKPVERNRRQRRRARALALSRDAHAREPSACSRKGPPRHFALTPVGALLKTGAPGSLRYMAMMFGEEFSTRAYEHIADCLRSGGDGVSEAYGKHDLGGAGRAPRAMRDLPARDDQFHLGRGATRSSRLTISPASSVSPMSAAATACCSPRSCAPTRSCRACCSTGRRWSRMCRSDRFAGCEGRIAIEPGSFFERVPDGCDAYLLEAHHPRLERRALPHHSRPHAREAAEGRPRARLRDGGVGRAGADAGQAARHRDAGDDGGRQGAHAGGIRATCSPRAGLQLNRIVPTGRPISVIEAVPA